MKTAVITGARGGVARKLTELLRGEGYALALVSRDTSELSIAQGDIAVQADVTRADQVEVAFAEIAQHFDRPIGALIHCAGNSLIAPITRTREDQYRSCMAINVDSAFFCAQAFLTQWLAKRAALAESEKPKATMVFFSSVVAGMGVANHPAIAAAKGAVEALTRSLAADHAAAGVRVNCIAPGLMRSPMTQKMLISESAEKQIAAQYPLGHFGDAEDAAELARFLMSDAARWITGQVLQLDGGFSAIRPLVRS